MLKKILALSFVGLFLPGVALHAEDRVRIASSTDSISYLPFYAAQSMGYFKDLSVTIDVVRVDSGPKAMSAIIGGDLDVILGANTTSLSARKAGVDVVLFAPITTQYSSNILVSQKWASAHGLTSASSYSDKLAAMKGLTIGITGPGSGTDQIVRYMAGAAKINPDRDMTIVSLGGDANIMMAAFSQARVDGLSISAPTSTMAIHSFNGFMLFNVGIGEVKSLDGYFQSGFAAKRDWLAKNRAAAVKLAKGVQMGLNALRDPAKSKQAHDLIRKEYYANLDASVFEEAWSDQILAMPKSVELTQKMVEDIVNFNNEFAKDKLDLKMAESAYTNEFAKQAVDELRQR